jgi:IclR family KDG regulon transcriptional repressor
MVVKTNAAPYRVQSAYDAFALLEMLIAANKPLTASQAAARTNDSRNRTFRLLKTLEERGYVAFEPEGNTYQPTLKLVVLSQGVTRWRTIGSVARPIMERLRDETGETVYLTTREREEVVCLLTFESERMSRISAQPGRRWSLGRGVTGQALLLFAPEGVRNQVFDRHPQIASHWESVRAHYDQAGVTFVDGRDGHISDEAVMALGVPIRDASGRTSYALGVARPVSRTSADRNLFRVALLESARALEDQLGLGQQVSENAGLEEVTGNRKREQVSIDRPYRG